MLGAKILAARAAGGLTRFAGRGGGTSLPGKLLIRMDGGALVTLGARLPGGAALISATNGKTTSAAMAASILTHDGRTLVHNRAGANMAGGVASALLAAARPGGSMTGELGLFEVDEAWLGAVAAELHPRALLLSNLFRDQLDRYGELETLGDRWADVVAGQPPSTALALCADDPLIADLGRTREDVWWFGVEDDSMALPGLQHASDSKHCRACGHPYAYDAAYLGHLGRYHCPRCGQRRPEPLVAAERIELRGTRSAAFDLRTPAGRARVELPLPGLYNVYNALGAAALTLALGVSLDTVVAGLEATEAAFGRAETIAVADHELVILLVKNPAGTNEVVRTLVLEEGELDLLAALNDNIADGRDVSWIWDADLELLAPRVRRVTCSGTRAAELALRLRYAGVPRARITVAPGLAEGLDSALKDAAGIKVYALPTYTALLELRELLAVRGHARRYWERATPSIARGEHTP